MKKLVVSTVAGVISLLIGTQSSQALTILGASSVSTNMGEGFGPVSNIINQSGLSAGYTNGEDLNTYLATNPTHTNFFSGFEWYSDQPITSGNVDFDLGSVFSVANVIIWNEEFQGVNQFRIITASLPDFSDSVDQGLFIAPNNPDGFSYGASPFTFSSSSARYVRLAILTSYNDLEINTAALGEVAFGVDLQAVPFEFSPALGIAILGVAGLAKKILKTKAKINK